MWSSNQVSLAYVKSLVQPQNELVIPPSSAGNSTLKELSAYGNFSAGEVVTPSVMNVPFMVVWLPWYGCTFIHRYGRVLQGKTLSAVVGPFAGDDFVAQSNFFLIVHQNHDVQVSPDLSSDSATAPFSSARLVGGYLQVTSDTTSATSVSISGQFHAGSLNDTVPLQGGHGAQEAFAPTALAQWSVSKKDGVVSAKMEDGIRAVLGPDISGVLHRPTYDTEGGVLWGGDEDVRTFSNLTYTTGAVFLSKYLSCTTPGTANLVIDGVPLPSGSNLTLIVTPSSGIAGQFAGTVHVHDLYAAMSPGMYPEGAAGPFLPYIASDYSKAYPVWTNGATATAVEIRHSSACPKNYMYLGTKVVLDPSAGFTLTTIRQNKPRVLGASGPARVIQWGQAVQGQTIRVQARLIMQATASGVAPYVGLEGTPSINADLPPFCTYLFNSTNPFFKRIYRGKDYEEVVKKLEALSVEDLMKSISLLPIASHQRAFEEESGEKEGNQTH